MSARPHLAVPKRPRISRGDLMLRIMGGAIFAGIIAIILLSNAQIARGLALATSRQPEPFTELYFNDTEHLPREAQAGQPATFSYHVANREDVTTHYTARITLTEGNTPPRTIQVNSFTLQGEQGHDQSVRFAPTKPDQPYELKIELIGTGINIHFRGES